MGFWTRASPISDRGGSRTAAHVLLLFDGARKGRNLLYGTRTQPDADGFGPGGGIRSRWPGWSRKGVEVRESAML